MEEILYQKAFQALAHYKVRYLVVGGIAVNLLGVPRMTKDLDLMLDLEKKNISRLLQAMKRLGYKPRVSVNAADLADESMRKKWTKEKGAVVFTFQDPRPPHDQIDIFLENPIDFKQARGRGNIIKAAKLSIPVVSFNDLIKLKSKAGRLQDQADIAMLHKVMREKQED